MRRPIETSQGPARRAGSAGRDAKRTLHAWVLRGGIPLWIAAVAGESAALPQGVNATSLTDAVRFTLCP